MTQPGLVPGGSLFSFILAFFMFLFPRELPGKLTKHQTPNLTYSYTFNLLDSLNFNGGSFFRISGIII